MKFIRTLLFAIAVLLTPFVYAAERLPNIVILYADDLGYGDLTCYNAESKIPTPNLDRLAKEGARFTDAHSSSGICTPSRYALLTGRYHWRKFHDITQSFGKSKFDPDRLTLPEMLQAKGYTTGAIGKWHLGWDWKSILKAPPGKGKTNLKKVTHESFDWSKPIKDGPTAHGFDYYFGDTVINFPPYAWIENDRVLQAPDITIGKKPFPHLKVKEGKWECRPGPGLSDWNPYDNIPITTQKGVEFIQKHGNGNTPYFLYFAYPSPHAPIIPNDAFDGKSKAGPYGDFVVETDDSIGKLLAAIESTSSAQNTLVIFSADNGPEHYAYARDGKYDHWSSKPLRGVKRDLFEGGHRVPFIVRWPGKISADVAKDGLTSQIDIMATLASLIGFELPNDAAEDSFNQLAYWKGNTDVAPRTSLIHNTWKDAYAIRSNGWTFIAHKTGYQGRVAKGFEQRHGYTHDANEAGQLFDMTKDISQKRNVVEQHPEKAAELKRLLKKIREQGHSAPRLDSVSDTTMP